jgi:outer membrane lipoprotein carrier protein
LRKPLISKGSITFEKPGSLRWEYLSPIPSILISHKGDIKRFIKQEGAYLNDEGAHLEAMQIVLQEISTWLGGQFDKSPGFNANLEVDNRITLTPKNKQMAGIILKIELLLSSQPGLIKSVTIFESKTSYTRLLFENTILNETIKPSLFKEP